ncbi:GNAT family N-acetyltransferase [Novosphingobium aerophilum]|uniref:GNAT family N-acetyltransferase n=1 Tax=Novosphingobium TaxID=165696 RepID=UPI002D780675|nr:GNAT family N-acetyltransferase [Novosphingobium sp. RL4]WRT92696.1 GNAT family N-acetyltransferase [Novosphingobium sp. RL4]
MNRQPVLEGDRLVLRPLRADDWDALYAAGSDREIWAVHPAHDRWQEPVFRQFFADALDGGGAFAIIDKESGAVIGSSRYGVPEAGEIEIGWSFLARAHWGSGLNAEMKRLMLEHALAHFERVIFKVGAENLISRKAMEHIGGRLTDRSFERETCGVVGVHVIYEITRESFAAGPLKNKG